MPRQLLLSPVCTTLTVKSIPALSYISISYIQTRFPSPCYVKLADSYYSYALPVLIDLHTDRLVKNGDPFNVIINLKQASPQSHRKPAMRLHSEISGLLHIRIHHLIPHHVYHVNARCADIDSLLKPPFIKH